MTNASTGPQKQRFLFLPHHSGCSVSQALGFSPLDLNKQTLQSESFDQGKRYWGRRPSEVGIVFFVYLVCNTESARIEKMSSLPPYVTNRIVLFDNICRLGSGSVRFIIKHDAAELFKFAAVQLPEGRELLRCYRMTPDTFQTMLYIENGQLYTKSTACLKILRRL